MVGPLLPEPLVQIAPCRRTSGIRRVRKCAVRGRRGCRVDFIRAQGVVIADNDGLDLALKARTSDCLRRLLRGWVCDRRGARPGGANVSMFAGGQKDGRSFFSRVESR